MHDLQFKIVQRYFHFMSFWKREDVLVAEMNWVALSFQRRENFLIFERRLQGCEEIQCQE
jgi:hypothetical protein